MQSIQNLGLAVISILAGMILDTQGYLLLEVFFIACVSREFAVWQRLASYNKVLFLQLGFVILFKSKLDNVPQQASVESQELCLGL